MSWRWSRCRPRSLDVVLRTIEEVGVVIEVGGAALVAEVVGVVGEMISTVI